MAVPVRSVEEDVDHEDVPMTTDTAGALPVRLGVDARLATQLVPHLEGALGWQVTHGDELPAALALVGVRTEPSPVPGIPWVLLVRDDDPPGRAAACAVGASAVLRWPDDRDRLATVAAELLHRTGPLDPGTTHVRIGGAAGGVGTTTVALALGGLLAWHGHPTLVVASGDVPVTDVPVVAPAALAAHRTWDAAAPVAGVPHLRVVATGPGDRARPAVPDGTIVLRDDGVTTDVDLLVCCRDRAGVAALDGAVAGAAVVSGRGALPADAWMRATRGRARQVHVDWSARVARAGAVRRVPTSLPGRWLAALAPLARSLAN